MMQKTLLLATSSLLLAGHHACAQERRACVEQLPIVPEPLGPCCTDDMPFLVDTSCPGGSIKQYLTKLKEAAVADMKPLLLHVPQGWEEEATDWADRYEPGSIQVVPQLSTKELYARMLEPRHASIYTKPAQPSTKARKAARRRAKAGRKASR